MSTIDTSPEALAGRVIALRSAGINAAADTIERLEYERDVWKGKAEMREKPSAEAKALVTRLQRIERHPGWASRAFQWLKDNA